MNDKLGRISKTVVLAYRHTIPGSDYRNQGNTPKTSVRTPGVPEIQPKHLPSKSYHYMDPHSQAHEMLTHEQVKLP
jgi:hypothetical protein